MDCILCFWGADALSGTVFHMLRRERYVWQRSGGLLRNVRINTGTVVVTSCDRLVETSGKNVALVGRYKHSLWGVVSSHSFIAYERPSYGTDPTRRSYWTR